MSLGNIKTSPVYTLTLPSTKKKIKYRPYNVGEQKKLLLAHIDEDRDTILEAVKDMIENCTYGQVDFDKSPTFDIEYIMIKLRSKSAGEVLDVSMECNGCGKMFPISINLDEVKVVGGADSNVQLATGLFMKMKYPTVKNAVTSESNDIDTTFKQLAGCIDKIIHEEDVYDAKDQPESELIGFLGRLTETQLKQIKTFVDNIPIVEYRSEKVCTHCNHKNKVYVTGITSFFI